MCQLAHPATSLLVSHVVLAPCCWRHASCVALVGHPSVQYDPPQPTPRSYRLKGFTPVSRVSDAAYASAAVASDDLITLASAANGGDLIVEITGGRCSTFRAEECVTTACLLESHQIAAGAGEVPSVPDAGYASHSLDSPPLPPCTDGVPAAPSNVYVPNVRIPASDPTKISFELDVPATDNIMGWEYELEFIPGTTNTSTPVRDANAPVGTTVTTFYASRLSATQSGQRLEFKRALADFSCDPGDGAYAACTGGKFRLTSIKALAWFDKDTHIGLEADNDAGRAAADKSDGTFTGKQVIFGSPLNASDDEWDAIFYVGARCRTSCSPCVVRRLDCHDDKLRVCGALGSALDRCITQ